MTEGIIAVKNTAPKYLKGAADQTIRSRFWLAYLREQGRIKLGDKGGLSTYWNVQAREPEIRDNGDAGQQVFSEHDAYEQLSIDVRGYVGTDRLTLKKKLMNTEPLAIVNLYGTKMENLVKSLTNRFGSELYCDGYATGNGNRLCGIESFMGSSTTVSADILAKPSDTYGGKSTALGALGGSWSTGLTTKPNANVATDWPYGSGDSQYDYIAPKLCNYSSTNWPSGDTTWRANCAAILRRARTWCRSTGGDDKAPMLHILSGSLYDDFEDYMETKTRAMVPHPQAVDMGFPDTLNYSGAMVRHEFDCPAGTGYGINVSEMLLFSIHDELFYSYGPEWDTQSLSDLFLIGFFGNMRFNPKHFAKYAAYA